MAKQLLAKLICEGTDYYNNPFEWHILFFKDGIVEKRGGTVHTLAPCSYGEYLNIHKDIRDNLTYAHANEIAYLNFGSMIYSFDVITACKFLDRLIQETRDIMSERDA